MNRSKKLWGTKSLKKKRPAPYGQVLTDEQLENIEQEFIDTYLKSEVKPLRMLFRIYGRYWKELLLSFFFYVIKNSPVIVFPIVTANVINAVIYQTGDVAQTILINVGILGVLLLLNIPMHMMHVKYFSRVARQIEAGLRGAMVRKLQKLSITFHKEMQSGRIQAKLIRDVETVHMLSSQLFSTIPSILMSFISGVVIVLSKNFIIFLFFLFCIPISLSASRFFQKKIRENSRNFRVDVESTSARLTDMVEMTQITRAHALEDREIEKLHGNIRGIANSGFRMDWIHNLFSSVSWVIVQTFQLGCLIFCVYLAIKGEILVGDISLYQTYFGSITAQVSAFLGMLPIITKGLDSLASIGEILSATDVEVVEGKEEIAELRGEYSFKNVAFSYVPNQPLLTDFNLEVKQGETIAFVGESGCGKTTTINLILGFNFVTKGEILVDGKDIRNINLHDYRSHIAIVPQNSVLFTGTIRENICYGVENVSEERLMQAIEAANLTSLLEKLPNGVDTMLYEHGANLSGGQRQRLSIARAIIRDPSVIIFDEATSALDTVSEREIQKAVDNMTQNRTTFIVAHRLSTIKNADRIAVLQSGVCVEIGSYDELMEKKGVFYKMQTAQ